MRLSERDRKLLWGRAANRCAVCKRELVIEATPTDRESIVGDEAHIIAESERGPRGRASTRRDLDTYDNAILLCKVDHRRVDDQPLEFTAERLRGLKAEHETWVRTALTDPDLAKADRALDETVEHQHAEQPFSRAMTRFGPSEWCPPSSSNGPEVVLRTVTAVPEPISLAIGRHSTHPVTRLKAEAREERIANALDNSTLTERIREMGASWHWAAAGDWRALGGSGNPDLTRVEFRLDWPQYRIRQPIGLSAVVLTGTTGRQEHAPGIEGQALVMAVDICLNIQELDSDRQPSEVAYTTTPPPAPAALSVGELASLMRTLLTSAGLAQDLAEDLLGQHFDRGHTGVWLQLNAVALERVVRLSDVRRLDGGLSISRFDRQTQWPLPDVSGSGAPSEEFIEAFLNDLLEASDYRDFRELVAQEVRPAGSDGTSSAESNGG